MKSLEQACDEVRLQVIAEFDYKGKPDLNNRRSADVHDLQMHTLFSRMADAEERLRRDWKKTQAKEE